MADRPSTPKFIAAAVILLVAVFALLGLLLYTRSGLSTAEQQIHALQDTQTAEQERFNAEIQRLEHEAAESARQHKAAQQEALAQVDQRAGRTDQRVRELANKGGERDVAIQDLYELQGLARADLNDNTAEFRQNIGDLRTAVGTAQSGVNSLTGEVRDLRATAATKAELEATAANLRRVTGDLGLLSDRVATNQTELAALRSAGERDYVDFQIFKLNSAIRLGEIAITLKRTDVGRQRFNLELEIGGDAVTPGRRIEKRDREVNEPLQFIIGESRVPYELVVNEVGQNQISGYLSRPETPESPE